MFHFDNCLFSFLITDSFIYLLRFSPLPINIALITSGNPCFLFLHACAWTGVWNGAWTGAWTKYLMISKVRDNNKNYNPQIYLTSAMRHTELKNRIYNRKYIRVVLGTNVYTVKHREMQF